MRLREHILAPLGGGRPRPVAGRDGALNVVVVGGGPTGVESVGALSELYHHNFAKDYPQFRRTRRS